MRSSVVRATLYLSLAALFALQPATAAPSVPTVVQGSGETAHGSFTAGPDGAEWQLPSGATLRLTPHSVVRVFSRSQSLDLGGGKTQVWSLVLTKGRVDIHVPARHTSAVLVSAGRVSAVVTGGRASVVAAKQGDVIVANTDAAVRTFAGKRAANVNRGRLHRIREHAGVTDEPLLASPTGVHARGLWLAPPGEPAWVGGLRWEPVPGAAAYEVELRRDATVLAKHVVREPVVERLARLEPGEYDVHVRPVTADGIPGAWSPATPLRVLGVELPPGAYAENGGVYLSGGQKISFSHAQGVEMTYVGAGKYVPANEAVGLHRNQRTIVLLRVPGEDEHAVLRLEPHELSAEVFAGPKNATWPKDPLELTVRLKTRAAAAAQPPVEVVPKVWIGVQELDVAWRRDGNELRATVPPQSGPGPWVVRVEVRNQSGHILGRDFVEVTRDPTDDRRLIHARR